MTLDGEHKDLKNQFTEILQKQAYLEVLKQKNLKRLKLKKTSKKSKRI